MSSTFTSSLAPFSLAYPGRKEDSSLAEEEVSVSEKSKVLRMRRREKTDEEERWRVRIATNNLGQKLSMILKVDGLVVRSSVSKVSFRSFANRGMKQKRVC